MAFPTTSDYNLMTTDAYNAYNYTTYPSSFTPDQLNIALNLGHAGLNVFGAVLNLLNVIVLILMVRRYGCTKNAYGLFLVVGVLDLSINILWSIYLFTVYARKGSPLPISFDPLLYNSNIQYLLINLAPQFVNFLLTASEFVILAMAVLSLIHTVIRSKSWISFPEVIAVLAGLLVVSVLLSWPGWLEIQLTAWKDRHDMTSPDFTEDKVINSIDSSVYRKAYDIIAIYIPYGLTFLLMILLICATRQYSLKEECHKVVVMLTAVLAWGLICETPFILVKGIWGWAWLPRFITAFEIARYGLVLKYSFRGLIYFSFNSLYRQTALCRAQSPPAAATAAPDERVMLSQGLEGQDNTAI